MEVAKALTQPSILRTDCTPIPMTLHGRHGGRGYRLTWCGVGEGWVVVLVSGQGRDWGTTQAIARRWHEEQSQNAAMTRG